MLIQSVETLQIVIRKDYYSTENHLIVDIIDYTKLF